MDLLRNLGSAAVSSIVQKSGLNLPFSLGEKVAFYEGRSIWTLHDATKRDDGSQVSVFTFDASSQSSKKNLLPLAKNALRKLRTVRHPDVLKFVDAVETDTSVSIVTERVQPLGKALSNASQKGARDKEDWIVWGLQRVSTALAFVNDSCASTHGNVRVDNVFISTSGEWKLGGFELLSNSKDDAAVLYTLGGVLPEANSYACPEVKKGGWSTLKEHHPSAADAYALGILLHCVFNPNMPLPATTQPPHAPPSPSSRGAIPTVMFTAFKRLLHPNAKARLSPASFLEMGMAQSGEGHGFFVNNRLVKVCTGLDQFSLNSEAEKVALLRSLKESASSLPPEFASKRVLPSLVNALEFAGAPALQIIPLILQLGVHAPVEEQQTVVVAPILKLYASQDRGTRMALLEHQEEYVNMLDKSTVSDKIWPHLQTGFTDTVPVLREATVKSIGLFSTKFNDRILNNDLLRHLARMQNDPEASIRTNTCILIGRLGPSLGYNTKRKMLVPAFARALKDTFVHARVAGLMAFMATVDCFDAEELATKVVPCVATALIDKEKLVRDQAFKAIELFVKKLEAHAATMPETAMVENGPGIPGVTSPATAAASQSAIVNTAAGAAGALAGWAMSSLSKKLVPGDLTSAMNSVANLDRSTSAPPPANASANQIGGLAATSFTPNAYSSQSFASLQQSRPKGLQLGVHKTTGHLPGALQAEIDENEDDGANAWGNGDLIDMNADEGDWGAFTSGNDPIVPKGGISSSNASVPKPISNSSNYMMLHTPSLAVQDDDEWGAIDPSASTSAEPPRDLWDFDQEPTYPTLPTPISQARRPSLTSPKRPPSRLPSHSPSVPMRSLSPVSTSSAHSDPHATAKPKSSPPSTVGMSKEEKAAEMARRKEERKQRIAQLKEQKKSGSTQS